MTIKLTGRDSRLSLLQIDVVKQKIESAFPGINVEIITRESRGDQLKDIPLHTVEGSDFFTQDIFDLLENGDADIAVHSLKDMSSEHFFGENEFAVIDRDDERDVAIFNSNIIEKIKKGESIVIGTCSPRREEMAIVFLKKALPQAGNSINIETRPIRGNVETRLRKLNSGENDATILATAGLNRLLRSSTDALLIHELLADKNLMLLPLIECVPAPCQGAIVAEAHYSNAKAIEVLERINVPALFSDCFNEKRLATTFGVGCIQQFGVTTIPVRKEKVVYAAGKDSEGTEFVKWDPLPALDLSNQSLYSTTDQMKDFFDYSWTNDNVEINHPVVFIANYKAIQQGHGKDHLQGKTILASGTKTWFELARQGYWVTASADALGFEFLLPSLQMPLLKIVSADVCILTHESAAKRWKEKGYHAVSNYKLIPKETELVRHPIETADAIFWSSFSQYEFYGKYAKAGVKHLCAGGETAVLLKQAGITPVIFPTIKSFQQWRGSFFPSHNAA